MNFTSCGSYWFHKTTTDDRLWTYFTCKFNFSSLLEATPAKTNVAWLCLYIVCIVWYSMVFEHTWFFSFQKKDKYKKYLVVCVQHTTVSKFKVTTRLWASVLLLHSDVCTYIYKNGGTVQSLILLYEPSLFLRCVCARVSHTSHNYAQ